MKTLLPIDDGQLLAASLRLLEKRRELEVALLGTVLAVPARGVVIAEENGVTAELFDGEDLSLIFAAASLLCSSNRLGLGNRQDRRACYRLAWFALKAEGLASVKCDARVWSCGPHWSLESLRFLFDSYPGITGAAELARKLVDLDSREREAREHLRYAWKLISTEAVA